jgi:hypothetical protein
MIALLKHHDVPMHMLRTARPGYIVCEDDFQIVAFPFADSEF